MSASCTVIITDPLGLHARPAADFVETAREFAADLSITVGDRQGNCKSLLSVLKLGITQGREVTLTANGVDESQAVQSLTTLLEAGHRGAEST